MSSEQRAKVMDLFHPSLDEAPSFVAEFKDLALRIACSQDLPVDHVMKLLAIMKANAHGFKGEATAYTEQVGSVTQAHKSALFDLASKVAHSCFPNSMYSSKTGKLRYIAIRQIAVGEQITFSYLGDLWSTPTEERRAQLLQSKRFVCHCKRCSNPDDCRAVSCHKSCKGIVRPSYSEDPASKPNWSCTLCGCFLPQDVKALLMRESRLEQRFGELQDAVHSGMLHTVHPQLLEQLLTQINQELSPTHFLAIRVLDFMAMVCASHAVHIKSAMAWMPAMSHPLGTPMQLRQQAARAGIRKAAICECLASGCCNGGACKVQHDACPEMSRGMFHAGQDLMTLIAEGSGGQSIPTDLAHAVQRYVRFMYMDYGHDDPEVCVLEEALQQTQLNKLGGKGTCTSSGQKLFLPQHRTPKSGRTCRTCGKAEVTVLRCSVCKVAVYCSQDCQKKDWRTHKRSCMQA